MTKTSTIKRETIIATITELMIYHKNFYEETKLTNSKRRHYGAYLCCKRLLEKVELL